MKIPRVTRIAISMAFIGLTKEQMAYCRGMKPHEAIVFNSDRQSDPTP